LSVKCVPGLTEVVSGNRELASLAEEVVKKRCEPVCRLILRTHLGEPVAVERESIVGEGLL
jgi:hypothetical protein